MNLADFRAWIAAEVFNTAITEEPMMDEPTDLQCPRCPDLPEPLICLGHPAGTTTASDVPAALLALDAERGPAEDARRRADGTGLTDTQTAAMLRALAEETDR
ncbi:hypothetical protein [Streptomyces phytophilus]|uniref:hypothetical protein n=1 Tax=Streptomyces phytophilus TaxID=722715 RepID=UPI00215D7DC9|nr:hypothetical protein [Streptomyces phytophilus]